MAAHAHKSYIVPPPASLHILCLRLVGPIHDKWARGIFSASHRGFHSWWSIGKSHGFHELMTNIEESREYHESYQNFFGASKLDRLEMGR